MRSGNSTEANPLSETSTETEGQHSTSWTQLWLFQGLLCQQLSFMIIIMRVDIFRELWLGGDHFKDNSSSVLEIKPSPAEIDLQLKNFHNRYNVGM